MVIIWALGIIAAYFALAIAVIWAVGDFFSSRQPIKAVVDQTGTVTAEDGTVLGDLVVETFAHCMILEVREDAVCPVLTVLPNVHTDKTGTVHHGTALEIVELPLAGISADRAIELLTDCSNFAERVDICIEWMTRAGDNAPMRVLTIASCDDPKRRVSIIDTIPSTTRA